MTVVAGSEAVDRHWLPLLGAVLVLTGCGGSAPSAPAPSAAPTLQVSSTAFAADGLIPSEFTCAGAGRRPPLAWSGDLRGAQALAVVVDDPDAPGGDYYHWVVVDVPAGTTAFGDAVPASAHQLKNSAGHTAWTPPCPPSGTHHYRFTVYGLSAPTGLGADTSLDDAFAVIQKTAVVQGRVTGLVTHMG
jgi:Raf kinase inhibitor-like YbhB/YbcL family protein